MPILEAPNCWGRSPLWVRSGASSFAGRIFNSTHEHPWIPPSIRYRPNPIHHPIDMVKAYSCSSSVTLNFTPAPGGGAAGTWQRQNIQTGPNTSYARVEQANSPQSAAALMRFFTVTPYQPWAPDVMLNGGWLMARGRWQMTGTFWSNPDYGLAPGQLILGVLPHKEYFGRLGFQDTRFSTQLLQRGFSHQGETELAGTFNLRLRPFWVAYIEMVPPVFDYPFTETPRELFRLNLSFERIAQDPTQLY